ncbi:MAG: hypothetical protein MHMPM18_004970 [Marteilia pararefringens]
MFGDRGSMKGVEFDRCNRQSNEKPYNDLRNHADPKDRHSSNAVYPGENLYKKVELITGGSAKFNSPFPPVSLNALSLFAPLDSPSVFDQHSSATSAFSDIHDDNELQGSYPSDKLPFFGKK